MRLLILPRYGSLGASSRLRLYQYVPALRAAGIAVDVAPLFGDDYVRALYGQRRSPVVVLAEYASRIGRMLGASGYDIVWIEKELLPWLPAGLERLPLSRARVVVDYDDAVFHRYDLHPSGLVRGVLGGKLDAVMRRADLVTAGNDYLVDRAMTAGCPWVERLPTVVDLQRYAVRSPATGLEGSVVIGWIGSPATADYLRLVSPVLEPLAARHSIRCVAIGARPDQVVGTPFEAVLWSEATEAEQVAKFDIGIMPLPDESWERGKCGYKLIQYMACGVPVVASPVGVNCEIVAPGVNGELASSTEEWATSLESLIGNPQLRQQMGMQGRRRVEDWYSLQMQAPRLIAMLQDAARKKRN